MSVKTIRGPPPLDCPLIQEIGGYCFCRSNTSKPLRERKAITYENTNVIIDFVNYPQLKSLVNQKQDGSVPANENEISKRKFIEVDVDFGLVSVETSAFREIQVIDSQNPKPQKKIEILGRNETNSTIIIDTVFRTLLPSSRNKSELLGFQMPQDGAGDSKPVGKQLGCLNKFRVVFEPELPSMNYSDIFSILVDDNVEIILKCRGFSEGPSICFSENVLNFGAQYFGDETRLKFAMHNHSDTQGQFQFDVDNSRSAFQICPTQGIIQPRSFQSIYVTFNAPKTRTFYKRVICLIHHQHPQILDMIGMCIPRPFFLLTPIDFCLSSDETKFLPFPSESNSEIFGCERFWGIHFSKELIDFGYHDVLLKSNFGSEASVLRVSSILPYDVIIEWVQDTSGIFLITPMISELSAHQSVLFEAHFNPAFPDTFYNGQLECYIYPIDHLWPTEKGPPWVYYPKEQLYSYELEAQKSKSSLNDDWKLKAIEGEAKDKENNTNQADGKTESGNAISKRTSKILSVGETEKPLIKSPRESSTALTDTKGKKGKSVMKKKRGKGGQKKDQVESAGPSAESRLDEPAVVVEDVVTVTQFKKDLEDTVSKLNASIPKQTKNSIFIETPQAFPLSLTIRHSGCSKKREYSLIAQRELRSSSILAHPSDLPVSASSLIARDGVRLKTPGNGASASNIDSTRERTPKASKSNVIAKVSTVKNFEEQMNQEGNKDETEDKKFSREESIPSELAVPLCLTIRVTGHTFEKHSPVPQFFVPKYITMPPTWPLTRIFRSFILKNNTDMPIYFDAETKQADDIYQIKPFKGVIPGNFHQIILVSMTPRMPLAKEYIYNCNVLFNLKDENVISLRGITQLPSLDIVILYKTKLDEREIVCQEAMPGCSSDTIMEFRNTSRFHYFYSFEPNAKKNLTIFTPIPSNGIIAPYETVQVTWRFAPKGESAYSINWSMYLNVMKARNESRNLATIYHKDITLMGVGRIVKLQCKPKNLKFGLIEIFKEKEMEFVIKNPTNTVVIVNLRIMHEDWLQFFKQNQIKVEPSHFILKGNQSQAVNVKVRPDRTNFQLYYIDYALEVTQSAKGNTTNEFKKICNISFIGNHAILKVTDVIMYGRHPIWDAERCWSMFSLNMLNKYLSPSQTVKEGTVPNVPVVTFNFPPAAIGSDPALFSILLANNEQLSGFWQIHMLPPKDWTKPSSNIKQDKNDYCPAGTTDFRDNKNVLKLIWTRKLTGQNMKVMKTGSARRKSSTTKSKAANNALNSTNIHHMDNFKISPLKGCLEAKCSQLISFRYSYKNVGKHEICVLLRIHPGIFIWIDIKGMTLEKQQPFIELMHSNEMALHPVCLADLDPPIQMFWMFNGGNVDCSFSINQDVFKEIKEENYGHEVLQCLTASGTIPPKSWMPVKMRFSPLELKEYNFSFIMMSNNQSKIIKLQGVGIANPSIQLRPIIEGESERIRKYKLLDPFVPITLSPTQIIFDQLIPTGQKANSILFITNISEANKISFSWPNVELDGGGSITFQPQSGVIQPKEQISIMVTVVAGCASITFSRMVRCLMIDETSLANYELMIKAWAASKSSLLNTTSELEAELRLLKKFGEKPDRPPSFSRLVTIKAYIGSVFGLLDSIPETEEMSMPFSGSILQPLKPHVPGDEKRHKGSSKLVVPPFMTQLSREIISNMLWDIVFSPSFTPYVEKISKACAPYYYEYKEAEMPGKQRKSNYNFVSNVVPPNIGNGISHDKNTQHLKEKTKNFLRLPRQATEDILENVIFNLIQEAATSFRPGKPPSAIKQYKPLKQS